MDTAKLESFILEKMSKTRIPSISIAIVKGDSVVYSRAFGFRDIEKGLYATPNTIYGIGSVTKSFTALAILKLVEEGKLDLEDPIEKYVPLDIKPFGESIRIHHLLTHTSGIPALAYAEAYIRGVLGLDRVWLPLATPEDVISFMRDAHQWIASRPGERFFYLNEGYVLLGYIISKISGMRYEDYVKKYILEPLEMRRTYFFEEEVRRDLDVATPYIVDREGKHIPSRFPYGITADGGLLSNAMDMARYLSMLINRGLFRDKTIIDSKYIDLMERKYIDVPFKIFGDEGYGYGLIVTEKFFDKKLIHHSGSVLVYTAFMGYIPSEKLGVVVLANALGYPLSYIGMYALALALGHDPEKELEFIKRDRILNRLEGIYETYKGTHRVTIKHQGDFLFIIYRDKYTEYSIPLIPEEIREDYAKFYTLSAGRKIYAEFYIEKERVMAFYERYRMVKVSELT